MPYSADGNSDTIFHKASTISSKSSAQVMNVSHTDSNLPLSPGIASKLEGPPVVPEGQVFEFREEDLSNMDHTIIAVYTLLVNVPEAHEVLQLLQTYLDSLVHSEPEVLRADLAYRIIEEGLPWISDQEEDKPMLLSLLGYSYNRRALLTYHPFDLEKAVHFNHLSNLLTPIDDEKKPRRLNDLGSAHLMKYQRLGDLYDLKSAIYHHSEANRLVSDEHADKPSCLMGLAASYMLRFNRLGDLADLGSAISRYEHVVLLTVQGDSELPRRLHNLGVALQARARRTSEPSDLERAISCHIRAVSAASNDNPYKPNWLCDLGRSLRAKFRFTGDISNLNDAILYHTQSISLAPDDHAAKPGWLYALADALRARFVQLRDFADLNNAISHQHRAISLSPDGHPSKPGLLSDHGGLLLTRYRSLGVLEDLDSAITNQHQAVLLTPEDHPQLPKWLSNLGASQRIRFEHLGNTTDIENSIAVYKQAMLLTPDGDSSKANRLSGLGKSYHNRFEHQGEMEDLDNAISCHTQAVSIGADGDIGKPGWLNNLGSALLDRYEQLGDIADLDESIAHHNQSISLTPDGHSDKPGGAYNLGGTYITKFKHSRAQGDVEHAIAYLTQAVLLTPDDHPFLASMSNLLGIAYNQQYDHFQDGYSLSQSIEYFRKAALSFTGNISDRLDAACSWAQLSRLSPSQSPLEGYKQAVNLIPQFVWLGATVKQRYRDTPTISEIISEAAATAMELKAYDLALEWLEEGCSIVWKQILQLRTPLDVLRSVKPELAQSIEETATLLDRTSIITSEMSEVDPLSLEDAAQSHRRLAEHYERLLSQARDLEGVSDFMRPMKASSLVSAARHSTVVMINTHDSRCDALVLLPDSNNITHVPLPHLSLKAVITARRQLTQFIHDSSVKRRGFKSGIAANPDVMNVLWHNAVKPVLDHLGYLITSPGEELPHITWCTSGPLAFLPLHAAGSYNDPHARVYNYAISSYTPTLSALLASHPDSDTFRGILAVGQANTPDFPPLPQSDAEIAQIQQQANTLNVEILVANQATVSAVLDAMEENSWIHMACHASQNRADPTKSAFHLHDGALDLATMMQKSLKNKGLAFLSACETATGDDDLSGEAVHLAAGMLMAGYPSVIATMWSIQDEDAPLIAERVYAELLERGVADTRKTAKALHDAVGRLRDRVGEKNFARWVPYIHIGI